MGSVCPPILQFRCLKFMEHRDRHDAKLVNHILCLCGLSVSVSGIRVDAAISHRSASASCTSASDTIGATDVLSAARTREGAEVGVALLIVVGPVAGIFRGSIVLAVGGFLLLAIAVLQFRRLRLGSLAGIAWTLGIMILLLVAMARISVSYSLAARLLISVMPRQSIWHCFLVSAVGQYFVFNELPVADGRPTE